MYRKPTFWCFILLLSRSVIADKAVPFSFKKKPLMELLPKVTPPGSYLMLPQKAADLEELRKQQITYLPHKKTTEQPTAWSIIKTYLELSGYSAAEQDSRFVVVRNKSIDGGAINREVIPVYAGVLPEELPSDDTRIRYIHYLKNFKVPTFDEKDSHPLSKMLKSFISDDASLLFDPSSNAIIISDKAFHAVALAKLLTEFDNRGIKEEVAYVPLTYVSAPDVVNIFNSLKIASGEGDTQGRKFIRSGSRADAISYFTQDTRVVADPMKNGVILMGRKNNVERIGEFIEKLLDVPPDSGRSILHYYDLQYLDSSKFAPLLTQIVSSTLSQNTQATQEPDKGFFTGVAIAAEESQVREAPTKTEEITLEQKGVSDTIGLENIAPNAGNRLIIAARQREWKVIERLLKKLDTPQPQVLLEILIVEFSYDQQTTLSGSNRSKTDAPLLHEGVQYLASHVTPVSSVLGSSPDKLAEDLLQVIGPDNVASQSGPGSLLLSLNDTKTPGIFGLLEVLDRVLAAKINAYPHITITNNQEGSVDATETRRTTGDLVTTTDGSFTIPIQDVTASINVTAKPQIVSKKKLRLAIGFTIEEFRGGQFDRLTRQLKTTAVLHSGEILAMGGLVRVDNLDNGTYTPVLGNIPFFGAFFRKTNAQTIRQNITLFVMPTILDVHRRTVWTEKTQDAVCQHDKLANSLQKSSDIHDPIYHLFFKEKPADAAQFVEQGTNMSRFRLETCLEPKLLRSTTSKKESTELFDPQRLKWLLIHRTNTNPAPRQS